MSNWLKAKPGRAVVLLLALTIAGLAIRLLLAPSNGFQGDMRIFEAWAAQLVRAPMALFYGGAARGQQPDHLPGDLWLLWGVGHLYQLLAPGMPQGPFFNLLVKLVPILADAGIGAMLFLTGRRLRGPGTGLLAGAFYLLNPAPIFLSAVWGQWDAVSACLMMAAFWLLVRGNPEWSAAVLGCASLVKPQMALLAPIAAIAWWRWTACLPLRERAGRLILPAVVTASAFSAVCLPFNVGLPPVVPAEWSFLERVQVAWEKFPFASMNGFNLWELLVGRQASSVRDSTIFLAGLSYQVWGTVLLSLAVLAVLALFWWRPVPVMGLWAGLVITFSLFMFSTRIHERYLLPALVVLLALAALVPALRWAAAALSASYLLNLYDVYAAAAHFGAPVATGPNHELFAAGLSALNLGLLVVVFVAGFAIAHRDSGQDRTPVAVPSHAAGAAMRCSPTAR